MKSSEGVSVDAKPKSGVGKWSRRKFLTEVGRFWRRGPDEELYLRAAQLCIDAGADQSQIPRWTREGHRQGAP